ncbi:MAG: HD domain-containing protein [Sandaracinaceae bacterium]
MSDGDQPDSAHHPWRLCVADLGTNSFHAMIVDAYPNRSFTVVDKLKEPVHLGEDGLAGGRLSEAAMARGLETLRRIRLLGDHRGAEAYLAFATSAIREASNGPRFVSLACREAGLEVRVIPGSLEARLIYLGVRRAVELPATSLVVDIGGGSTELIVASAESLHLATSLKLGAGRMIARFPEAADGSTAALRAHLAAELRPVLEVARGHGVRALVGSSGTMEALGDLCRARLEAQGRSSEHRALGARAFSEAARWVESASRETREEHPAIEARRVDQIVAGAALVRVLLEELPTLDDVTISPYALREGMVVHFLEENGERLRRLAPLGDVRRRQVLELAVQHRFEEKHARHVAALALALFRDTAELHGRSHRERELLEYAALLHDIGRVVSWRRHHKHSRYLIEQAEWHAFDPEEVAIMANVARYHRRARPKTKHGPFRRLSSEARTIVRQLASLLRLANGLDRSRVQAVRGVSVEVGEDEVVVTLQTRGDAELELEGGRYAAKLFERTFDRRVRFEVERPAEPGG